MSSYLIHTINYGDNQMRTRSFSSKLKNQRILYQLIIGTFKKSIHPFFGQNYFRSYQYTQYILCLLSKLGRKSLISKNWHYVPEMQRLLAPLAFANRGGLFLHRVVLISQKPHFMICFPQNVNIHAQLSPLFQDNGAVREEFSVINNELFKLPRQTTYLQLYLNHSNHTERNNNIMSSTLQ